MKCSRVEFKTNDGKDDNSEEHEQTNLKKRRHGFDDRFEHHLQTFNFINNQQKFLTGQYEVTKTLHVLEGD